jgi:ribosomal protein S19E (S16A)
VNNTKELVIRMDSMVTIMNKHSEIHGRVLEVLTEAGLVDKQGNTVVNNGGNSTVTNISTQQSSIMDFRDQVLGRLKSS